MYLHDKINLNYRVKSAISWKLDKTVNGYFY